MKYIIMIMLTYPKQLVVKHKELFLNFPINTSSSWFTDFLAVFCLRS